jgi:hypothetical protein
MIKPSYQQQLESPLWQRRRLEILKRDDFTCQCCGDKEEKLHVHHNFYTAGLLAWEYPDYAYKTLCATCHKHLTIHITATGSENEFALLKCDGYVFVYSKGKLTIHHDKDKLEISEQAMYKSVQFLINNWLKNE